MIADTTPSSITCCDHSTGFALHRFEVKTAAAALLGPRLTTRARSFAPVDLRLRTIPAASNPAGAVTLTVELQIEALVACRRHIWKVSGSWSNTIDRQAEGFRQAEGDIGRLNSRSSRALDEVVDCCDGDYSVGCLVYGKADQRCVRPEHVRDRRKLPLWQHV